MMSDCAMIPLFRNNKRKKLPPQRRNKRTKVLSFSTPRHDNSITVSGSGQCVRLYRGKLGSNDVLVGSIRIGGVHLKSHHPGNRRYLSILCQHYPAFVQATGDNNRRNAIVHLILQQVVQTSSPPTRFMERRVGPHQWIGMNSEDVVKMILHDLRHHIYVPTIMIDEQAPPSAVAQEEDTALAIPQVSTQQGRHTVNSSSTHKQQLPTRRNSNKSKKQTAARLVSPPATTTIATTDTTDSASSPAAPVADYFKLPAMAEERSRLSDYNQNLLGCMELFEATPGDLAASRNRHLGDLGLRCRHCAAAGVTPTAPYSSSFPGRLAVMEFNFFLIAAKHFVGGICQAISPELRSSILTAKRCSQSQTKARGGTGVQTYFYQMARLTGLQNSSRGGIIRRPLRTVKNPGPSISGMVANVAADRILLDAQTAITFTGSRRQETTTTTGTSTALISPTADTDCKQVNDASGESIKIAA